MRRCWTCNTEHDLDVPCRQSPAARARQAAGSRDDWTSDDLFDTAEDAPKFGPVIEATYAGEDACCGDWIEVGQEIRADGQGGWIHATTTCERLAR
jgi:hypothetical protein